MKNIITILFIFSLTLSFGQSKSSLNLVFKVGQINWETQEFSSVQSLNEALGKSYTLGIIMNRFLNKKKNLSLDYGVLNQFNQFKSTGVEGRSNSNIGDYLNTIENRLRSLEILLPILLNGHLGNWNIYGGFTPTYRLKAELNQKFTIEIVDDPSIFSESEYNTTTCNSLLENCSDSNRFPIFKDFDIQYSLGIGYQIKRVNLFVEYSEYLWAKDLGTDFSDLSLINSFVPVEPTFGSFGSAFNFGMAFRIY